MGRSRKPLCGQLYREFESHSLRNPAVKLRMASQPCTSCKSEKKARDLEKYLKTGSGKAIHKKRILTDESSASVSLSPG